MIDMVVMMVFNLDLGCSPREDSQILPLIEEHSLVKGQLSTKDFGLSFQQSHPDEILNAIYSQLFLGLKIIDIGLPIPNLLW